MLSKFLFGIFVFGILLNPASAKTKVYQTISNKIYSQLPKTIKIAIQPLTEKKTKLPQSILNQVMADFEAALLVSSSFEANIVNRARLLEVWSDATEFNAANFKNLFKKAGADALLVINLRGVQDGLRMSVSVYATKGKKAGQVIAGSGTHLVPINWQKEAGLNVNTIDKTLKNVLAEINRISKSGGIISGAKTYAEFYHNARIYQQRGEIDLAMSEYERALKSEILFVDPILDLMDLANRRYGKKGAILYLKKKLKPKIPKELYYTGLAKLAEVGMESEPELWKIVLEKSLKFPPFYLTWIKGPGSFAAEVSKSTLFTYRAVQDVRKLVYDAHQKGRYQSFYIDQVRGAKDAEYIEYNYKYNETDPQMWHYQHTRASVYLKKLPGGLHMMQIGAINDQVDLSKPVIFCIGESQDAPEKCFDVMTMPTRKGITYRKQQNSIGRNSPGSSGWLYGSGFNIKNKKFYPCIKSVEYTDKDGNTLKTPVILKLLKYRRPEYQHLNFNTEERAAIRDCVFNYKNYSEKRDAFYNSGKKGARTLNTSLTPPKPTRSVAKRPTHTPKEIIYHVVGTKRPLSPKLSAALKKTLKEALAPSSLQGYHKVTASVLESYAERKRNPNNSGGIQIGGGGLFGAILSVASQAANQPETYLLLEAKTAIRIERSDGSQIKDGVRVTGYYSDELSTNEWRKILVDNVKKSISGSASRIKARLNNSPLSKFPRHIVLGKKPGSQEELEAENSDQGENSETSDTTTADSDTTDKGTTSHSSGTETEKVDNDWMSETDD